jgi:hypothetical protein
MSDSGVLALVTLSGFLRFRIQVFWPGVGLFGSGFRFLVPLCGFFDSGFMCSGQVVGCSMRDSGC